MKSMQFVQAGGAWAAGRRGLTAAAGHVTSGQTGGGVPAVGWPAGGPPITRPDHTPSPRPRVRPTLKHLSSPGGRRGPRRRVRGRCAGTQRLAEGVAPTIVFPFFSPPPKKITSRGEGVAASATQQPQCTPQEACLQRWLSGYHEGGPDGPGRACRSRVRGCPACSAALEGQKHSPSTKPNV
jgi:hypothetical protein